MDERKQKKNFTLNTLNKIIVILYVFTGFGIFLTFTVIRIWKYLIIPFIALNAALAVLYKKNKEYGIHKKALIRVRIITILFTLLCISLPFVCISFENVRIMYQAKKIVFCYGVRAESSWNMKKFPNFLPKKCEDYYFETDCCIHAPDSSTEVYLSFYTDTESLKKLEKECINKNRYNSESEMNYDEYIASLNLTDEQKSDPEYMNYMLHSYLREIKGMYGGVFQRLDDKKISELDENTVIYTYFLSDGHGYAFDYDSGLFIMWD